MRLDFFLLADEATVEEAEGGGRKLNILGGGVTHVRAPAFPYELPAIAIVIRFFLDDEDAESTHTVEVRVIKPDGQKLIAIGHRVEISESLGEEHPEEEPSLFVVGTINKLPLTSEGRYRFELAVDDEVIDAKVFTAVAKPSGLA